MSNGRRAVVMTLAAGAFASAAVCGEPGSGPAPAPRSGIWCRRTPPHPVPRADEDHLVLSLRRITGLDDLRFDDDGALRTGDLARARQGSSTARRIVGAALASGMGFGIEGHSGSELHFAQLDAGTSVADGTGPAPPHTMWRVRLDFKDLVGFAASPAVRAAFDPGFAVLHELLHGLGFQDPENGGEIGPLEEVLNRAREELGLPLRDRYAAESREVGDSLLSVRLRFRSASADRRGKARFEYLSFLVDTRLVAPAMLVDDRVRTIDVKATRSR